MSISDRASLYGSGVFTTIAIKNGLPFLWERHWARLRSNAAAVGIELEGYRSEDVLAELQRQVERAGLDAGKARITFSDARASDLWPGSEPAAPTRMSIVVAERREMPRDLRLGISPFPVNSRSPLGGIKSCNYLEPVLSLEDAKKRGFHEAVRLNERGIVTGACMANVFWAKGGRLFTPALSTGCLPGTTREFVLENLECEEVEAEIGELDTADSIFLTSAGLGAVEAAAFEGRPLFCSDNAVLKVLPF